MTDAWVSDLYAEVYRQGDLPVRTRATLQRVYFLALQNRKHEAETLLLLSGAMEQAAILDVPVQILCNCALAQLGLCAFRMGTLKEAQTWLRGLCARGRASLLLGQDAHLTAEWAARQKPLRRPRLNPRFVEAVYRISTLLLEAPSSTLEGSASVDHGFAHELREFERAAYVGPAGCCRECVFAAAVHLRRFDWQSSATLLAMALKSCAPAAEVDGLSRMIQEKVKAAAMKGYLASCSSVYHSLELSRLSDMFSLDQKTTRSIVAKMMLEEHVLASWDETSQIMLFEQRTADSQIHNMALQLVEKARSATDNNEFLVREHKIVQNLPYRVPKIPIGRIKMPIASQPLGSQQLFDQAALGRSTARAEALVPPVTVFTQTVCPAVAAVSVHSMRQSGTQLAPSSIDDGRGQDALGAENRTHRGNVGMHACSSKRWSSGGRQSPFHKTLSNLDKAVQKWLGQGLPLLNVEERIRNSKPAQHLKTTHGAAFREQEFICNLLARLKQSTPSEHKAS